MKVLLPSVGFFSPDRSGIKWANPENKRPERVEYSREHCQIGGLLINLGFKNLIKIVN